MTENIKLDYVDILKFNGAMGVFRHFFRREAEVLSKTVVELLLIFEPESDIFFDKLLKPLQLAYH